MYRKGMAGSRKVTLREAKQSKGTAKCDNEKKSYGIAKWSASTESSEKAL